MRGKEAMVIEMDVKPVRSRDLALIGYDAATSVLEVVFRAGGVYRYQQVPEEVYQGLMQASSHGSYFQKHIKGRFSYTKVS